MTQHPRELHTDILVAGGGMGGCAAAWAALRQGRRVIMVEETDWIGGQMTSQAVPPDEHPWIETCGGTRSYRRVREGIRAHYRRYYPLTRAALDAPHLNPGNGFVSAICHEPKVGLAVLQGLLAPYEAAGRLQILLRYRPTEVAVRGDHCESVTFTSLDNERQIVVSAPYIIDATENGDLLPLGDIEHVTGAESRDETGEPHAAATPQPHNMQAISWCFVISHDPLQHHVIERPASYDHWRAYVPPITPTWGSNLLSWSATHPITLEPVVRTFSPTNPEPHRGPMDLWTFRRIADRHNFTEGFYDSDIVLVNWPQIDYLEGNLVLVSPEEAERHRQGARELSLSMLYWMQTEAPRPDGGTGWPGLRLRPDITGTCDGLAKAPYIREARRIRGLFTVLEQHVGTEARMEATGRSRDEVRAASFPDSVGIGAYRIDLHPSTGGDNYIDVSALPFEIPLGAIIPQRMRNVLAGGKNLSVTHITNGCYRLHPVEWNVGEAAGLLAAWCLERALTPHAVHASPALLEDFRQRVRSEGIETSWPQTSPL